MLALAVHATILARTVHCALAVGGAMLFGLAPGIALSIGEHRRAR